MENIFVNKNMFNFDEEALEKIKQTVSEINNREDIEKIYKDFYSNNDEEDGNMTFEDALDLCDFEIQVKYDYLDELLCNIDDEMMYLTEEIERAKVDEEVAEVMWKNGFNSAREKLVSANRKRSQLQNRLEYLEEEYEIVMDMWDEVFLGILANLE